MANIDPAIVSELVSLARDGATAAQIMHTLVQRLPAADQHTMDLIKYMREAFGLSLAQAKPIAGWAPNGTGELNDSRLNELLIPDILGNKGRWAR
jgi:hypothetical protein